VGYERVNRQLNSETNQNIGTLMKETVKHAARKELDHLAFLNNLIEGETCSHKERSIERRIKNAKLPCIKTLEQFNWNYPKKINRMQVENLFRLNFIEKKENIIFLGPVGCAKVI